MGIKENQELAQAIVSVVNTGIDVFEDGQFDFSEVINLIPAADKGQQGIEGITLTDDEIRDFTLDEFQQVLSEYDKLEAFDNPISNLAAINMLKGGHSAYVFGVTLRAKNPEA